MRNFLIYTAIVCLIVLNICLLLGAKPEPPPDYYLTSEVSEDNMWTFEEGEDLWLSLIHI